MDINYNISGRSLRLAEQYVKKVNTNFVIYRNIMDDDKEYIGNLETRRLLDFMNNLLDESSSNTNNIGLSLEWLLVGKMFEELFINDDSEIRNPVIADYKYTYNEYMQTILDSMNINTDYVLSEMRKETRRSLYRIEKYRNDFDLQINKNSSGNWTIYYGSIRYYVSNDLMEWLKQLYENNDNYDNFNSSVFKVISRYSTIDNELLHISIPQKVYEYAVNNMGVIHECFASPLNANINSYSSPYPDTDYAFGSLGSFFEIRNIFVDGGTFIANPPAITPIIDSTLLYVIDWMKLEIPLTFIITIPNNIETNIEKLLDDNENLITYDSILDKESHCYVVKELRRNTYKRICDTRIIILQNDIGADSNYITEELIAGFIDAFNISPTKINSGSNKNTRRNISKR